MNTASATFAMGCFWSPDARFGSIRGVVRTRVGYAGGTRPDPTYERLGDHTECVQVDYDLERISYAQLLQIFWTGHNPAKPVWGRQYMSAIFHHDAEQQRLAMASVEEQTMNGLFRFPTQLLPLQRFYSAEPYHQKYALRSHGELFGQLRALHPSDAALVDSTEAARLNGALDGFGELAPLEQELVELGVAGPVAARWMALVGERRRPGGG